MSKPNTSNMLKKVILSLGMIWLAFISIYGCGSEDKNPLGPTTGLLRLNVSPTPVTVLRGGTQTFAATGGTGTYTWTVSDPALGSVNPSTGAFTAGNATGVLTVTATDGNGLSGMATVTINSALISITPAPFTTEIGATTTLSASGGTGTFSWTSSNPTLGSIVASTGVFTAGLTPGTITVTATDTAGNTATATVTITTSTITVSPPNRTIGSGGTQTFTATGGSNNYTWSVSPIGQGATIVSTTGVFSSGTGIGIFTITATDTNSSTGTATITINPITITVAPQNGTVVRGGTQTFTATGGTGAYTWRVNSTGAGASTIGGTGVFTAGTAIGTVIVTATDTVGNTGTATITVIPTTLTVTPPSKYLERGRSWTFTATGGTGSFTWSVVPDSLASIGNITGVFTAGPAPGVVTVFATDSGTNIGSATVTIFSNPLTIIPLSAKVANAGTYSFSASGGTGVYFYSMVTGGGTIGVNSGLYTAKTTAGLETVRVTDSGGNTSTAIVTVLPAP